MALEAMTIGTTWKNNVEKVLKPLKIRSRQKMFYEDY